MKSDARFAEPRWLSRGPLARYLVGVGLELGPGHVPFPNPYPGLRIFLVDPWRPAQSLELYPELGDAPFPEPDVICDLAVSSLDAFARAVSELCLYRSAMSPEERAKDLSARRDMSIHVHCWDPLEFNEQREYVIVHLGKGWDLVEAFVADELDPTGIEFGYVLRKSPVDLAVADRLHRRRKCWMDVIEHRRRIVDALKGYDIRAAAPGVVSDAIDSAEVRSPGSRRLQMVYKLLRERLG